MSPLETQSRLAVLFALGGTLVETRDYEAWSSVSREVGVLVEPNDLADAFADPELPPEDGPGGGSEARWGFVLSTASRSRVAANTVRAIVERVSRLPIPDALFSDAPRCLERLRRDGHRLGVLSGVVSVAAAAKTLRRARVGSCFDAIISSGSGAELGAGRKIFQVALAQLSIPSAAGAVYVGNELRAGVDAAEAVGISGVWLNRSGTGHGLKHREITSLSELPRVVQELERHARVKYRT